MAMITEEMEKTSLTGGVSPFGDSVPCFRLQANPSGSPSVESVSSVVQLHYSGLGVLTDPDLFSPAQ